MELGIEFAVPETWLNDLYRATDIAARIDAHTAEALADAMRVLDEAIEALTEISKRVPDYGHEGVGAVARYALDAITKLKGKQG